MPQPGTAKGGVTRPSYATFFPASFPAMTDHPAVIGALNVGKTKRIGAQIGNK